MEAIHIRQVLEMLNEGKINPEEAEKLIESLVSAGTSTSLEDSPSSNNKKPLKFLRVSVVDNIDEIDIRIPIKLLRFGMKFSQVLPPEYRSRLEEHGIDLNSFRDYSDEELVDALADLSIKINDDTATVRVFAE